MLTIGAYWCEKMTLSGAGLALCSLFTLYFGEYHVYVQMQCNATQCTMHSIIRLHDDWRFARSEWESVGGGAPSREGERSEIYCQRRVYTSFKWIIGKYTNYDKRMSFVTQTCIHFTHAHTSNNTPECDLICESFVRFLH